MHVGGERSGRGAVGQAALHLTDFGEVHARTAEFFWNGHLEVTSLAQFLEVLAEEAVLAVVDGGTRAKTLERIIGQKRHHCGRAVHGGGHGLPPLWRSWLPLGAQGR